MALCITFRLIYDAIVNPSIGYNADSATYWLAGIKLINGTVDAYRTPLYPLVLQLINQLGNNRVFENIVFFQQLISYISIIPFYWLTTHLFSNKPISFAASLTYGCHPSMLIINYGIFADSLLISCFVFFLFTIDRFFQKPSGAKWLGLNVFAFFIVMLKPVSVILYPILFIMGLYLLKPFGTPHLSRLPLKSLLPGFLIGVALLGGFVTLNKVQNDYPGISTVTHDNRFANVVLSRAYQTIADEKLVSIIDTARYYGHYYTIFYLNNDHQKYQQSFDAFPSQYKLNDNMLAVRQIPPNSLGYNRQNIEPLIKKAALTSLYIKYMYADLMLFSGDTHFYVKGGLLNMIIYISFVILLYQGLFNKRIHPIRVIMFLLGTILLYTSIVGGIRDGTRERVLLPCFPFLVILFYDLVNESWKYLKPFLWKITNRRPPLKNL